MDSEDEEAKPGPSKRRSIRLEKPTKEQPACFSTDASLSRWCSKDKRALVRALEKFGNYDFEAIAKELGTKTPSQVEDKIKEIRAMAIHSVGKSGRARDCGYLDRWINRFANDGSENEPVAIIPTFLKWAVPLFEDLPNPSEVGVDFKEAYTAIGNAIEGKEINVSASTSDFLRTAFAEVLNTYAHHGIVTDAIEQGALKKWAQVQKEQATVEPDTEFDEHVQFLASSKSLNPLNVPVPFLKSNATHNTTNPPFVRVLLADLGVKSASVTDNDSDKPN